MNYGRYVRTTKGRLDGLERLEDRLHHAMLSTSVPDLSVEEIVMLQNGSYLKKPEKKKNPRQIVTDWCEAEKGRIVDVWKVDRHYFPDETPDSPPDTSLHDAFTAKVAGWAMLEALKVVKIFEEIDALSLTALRLTPEGIHRLLEDTRGKPAWCRTGPIPAHDRA